MATNQVQKGKSGCAKYAKPYSHVTKSVTYRLRTGDDLPDRREVIVVGIRYFYLLREIDRATGRERLADCRTPDYSLLGGLKARTAGQESGPQWLIVSGSPMRHVYSLLCYESPAHLASTQRPSC
jgi:hypothetical protein